MRPVLLAHRPTRNRRPSYHLDPMTGRPARPPEPGPEPAPVGSLDVYPTAAGDVAFVATSGGRRIAIVFDVDTAGRIRGQIERCEARARETAAAATLAPGDAPDHAPRIELGADPVVVEVPIPPEVREAIDELTHGDDHDPAQPPAPAAS